MMNAKELKKVTKVDDFIRRDCWTGEGGIIVLEGGKVNVSKDIEGYPIEELYGDDWVI